MRKLSSHSFFQIGVPGHAMKFVQRQKALLGTSIAVRANPEIRTVADALKKLPPGEYVFARTAFPKDASFLGADWEGRELIPADTAEQIRQKLSLRQVYLVTDTKRSAVRFAAAVPGAWWYGNFSRTFGDAAFHGPEAKREGPLVGEDMLTVRAELRPSAKGHWDAAAALYDAFGSDCVAELTQLTRVDPQDAFD